MSGQRCEIPGSTSKPRAAERWSSPADPNAVVSATIALRRRKDSAKPEHLGEQLLSGSFHPVPREQAEQMLSADPDDLAIVRSFLTQHGLTVTKENAEARTLHVEGTVQQMNQAFGIQLGWFEGAHGRHLGYEGALSIPESLSGIVTAVLGLDQRPIATHHRSNQ